MKKDEKKNEPPYYEYRTNKGYFYGPGAPKDLCGKPLIFGTYTEEQKKNFAARGLVFEEG